MLSILSRPFIRVAPRAAANVTSQHRFYAQQSYGGGEGDPKGDDPQNQGSNTVSSDLEHPGPPPPAEGQGTGGGPTKAGDGGHGNQNESSGSSSSSSSKKPSSSGGGSGKSAGNGAQPKLHSPGEPGEHSEEVKQHNREMDNRHGRAQNKVDQGNEHDVGKGFWGGECSTGSYWSGRADGCPQAMEVRTGVHRCCAAV